MVSSARRVWLAGVMVAAAGVIAAACGSTAPTAVITGLLPAEIRYDQNVQLTIIGSGFAQRTIPDAQNPAKSALASPSVRIDGHDVAEVTFVSATALTVAFGRPYDLDLISRDDVTVTVTNPEGEEVAFAPLRILGPRSIVIGTAAEPAPGDANSVAVPFRVLDQDGELVPIIGDPLLFTATTQPSTATAAVGTLGVTSSGGFLDVDYDLVGPVEITFSGAVGPWSMLLGTDGRAVFIPGPPVAVRVLDRAGPAPGPVTTFLRVEDGWGNPTPSTIAYSGTPFTSNCPSSATFIPSTVAIAQGSTSGAFTVSCTTPSPNPMPVNLFGNAWISSGGLITFQ